MLDVPQRQEYNNTQSANISCNFSGYPLTNEDVSWRKLNSSEYIGTVFKEQNAVILYLENLTREQSGIYECYVKRNSTIYKTVEIIVRCKYTPFKFY